MSIIALKRNVENGAISMFESAFVVRLANLRKVNAESGAFL